MEDYKCETMKVYDSFPDIFDKNFDEYAELIKKELHEIAAIIPKKSAVIDIGSGPGNQALFFKQHGHDVLCLDISEEMLKKCREKGLRTIKADFENLNDIEDKFDFAMAYTSLLHIPKNKIETVIKNIRKIIKPRGCFLISLKEGRGEGFVEFKNSKRWFALYKDEEIKKLLKNFIIIKTWKNKTNDKVFLDYICKK